MIRDSKTLRKRLCSPCTRSKSLKGRKTISYRIYLNQVGRSDARQKDIQLLSQTNKNITAEIIDDDIHLGRFSRSNEREIVRFDWKFYNSLILSSEFCAFAGEKQNEGDEAEELFAN